MTDYKITRNDYRRVADALMHYMTKGTNVDRMSVLPLVTNLTSELEPVIEEIVNREANSADKITRVEVIDHTVCSNCRGFGTIDLLECSACHGAGSPGRTVIVRDDKKKVDFELQDDARTLKIFIHEKYKD